MKQVIRCEWANSSEEMQQYHDNEWGRPSHDDRIHFEFLILEAAQAGLTWSTILKRRQGYRSAFANFDPKKVAKFGSVQPKVTQHKKSQLANQSSILLLFHASRHVI